MRPNTPKELASSTGFKKRLRPISKQKDHDLPLFRAFDINNDIYHLQTKNRIALIQEEINRIDFDKKIRSGSGFTLEGVRQIKKWISNNRDYEREQDFQRALRSQGCQNTKQLLSKLFRCIRCLDPLLQKQCQLQCITILKYQQLYSNYANEFKLKKNKIQQPNVGLLTQSVMLVQRYQHIFDILSKVRKDKNQGKQKQEGKQEKGIKGKSQSETNEQNLKIKHLQKQLQKYKDQNKSLQNQLQFNNETKNKQNGNQSGFASHSQISKCQKHLKKIYQNRISNLTNQLTNISSKYIDLQSQLMSYKKQKTIEQQSRMQRQQKKNKKGSYQQCLQLQMVEMKAGFQRKVKNWRNQIEKKDRQGKVAISQLKKQLQTSLFQKKLLIKKWDLLQK